MYQIVKVKSRVLLFDKWRLSNYKGFFFFFLFSVGRFQTFETLFLFWAILVYFNNTSKPIRSDTDEPVRVC